VAINQMKQQEQHEALAAALQAERGGQANARLKSANAPSEH
jgi:hypothetical protein